MKSLKIKSVSGNQLDIYHLVDNETIITILDGYDGESAFFVITQYDAEKIINHLKDIFKI